jgi:hypothetical protein
MKKLGLATDTAGPYDCNVADVLWGDVFGFSRLTLDCLAVYSAPTQ